MYWASVLADQQWYMHNTIISITYEGMKQGMKQGMDVGKSTFVYPQTVASDLAIM